MNLNAGPSGDLQRIWRENDSESGGEDAPMTMQLLREKQRSLWDLIWGQDMAEYILSLVFAPLTALAAWKAPALFMRIGYSIVTVMLIVSAVVIFLNERDTRAFRDIELSVAEYHRRLIHLHDQRIRFLKSVKFWYAIPLFLGGALVLFPVFEQMLPPRWGIVVLAGLLLIAWLGVWHMNDVRRVRELQRRREEIRELVRQLEQR